MMLRMRTTLTLDPDVAARLREMAAERRLSLKEVVNQTLRAGFSRLDSAVPYRTPTKQMGLRPGSDVRKAAALAAALEDEEIVRKLELRK